MQSTFYTISQHWGTILGNRRNSAYNSVLKEIEVTLICVAGRAQSSLNSATSWTVVCQAPPSMEPPRQEYWHELPFPTPEDRPTLRWSPGLLHFLH